MKFILTHKSWNFQELVGIFKRSGSYTMCTLPHYRYQNVRSNCKMLEKKGFIERFGKGENQIYWKITDLFKEWMIEFDSGLTKMWPLNWIKERKKQEIAA